MSRFGHFARTYWFDLVVLLLAAEACVEVIVRHGSPGVATTTLWFVVPALAVTAVPLLVRRRFPFGGPAAYWVLGGALSFVDGRLLTSETSVFVLGMAAAFLLGDVDDRLKARIGLAIVVGSAAIIVYNVPGQ